MEQENDTIQSPEGSVESPAAEAPEDKDEGSNNDFVDSPEREETYECIEDGPTKNFEFSSHNSLDGTSTMEGELDFEDEVQDEKEYVSKESLDEDSQQRGTAEQVKIMENDNPEEIKETVSEDEDGQISADEQALKTGKGDVSVEEGEDDGELTDEDDLEEGEVKDSSPTAKTQTRQVCRFFNRGQCTWGTLCRFLHLSVNDHGNYNMFAPNSKTVPNYGPPGNGPIGTRGGIRSGPDYHLPPPPPPLPPPPPAISEPAPLESAWERGLRHAKELIKKSTRRKEQEPDFEEKRLNLSLSNDDNERDPTEFDKENDFYSKPHQRKQSEPFNKYEEVDDVFDNGEREAREHWRGGRYENFEIRWTRHDVNKDRRQDKERSRNARFSTEREKPKNWRNATPGNKWRDERLSEVQTARSRADEWRDPWRRSKTPKGRRSRSRGRSHGSYSSVSSRSYSERSSHSSYSYSRSSSHSSFYSSRSPSPNKLPIKHKPAPRKDPVSAKVPARSSPYKRKPIVLRRTLSRSCSRSRSSHSLTRSRSTSSRSITRTPSVSRSRSYSRSLSMDSVSSASSSISRSSSRSGLAKTRNTHVSVLKREEAKTLAPPLKTEDVKPTTSSLFEEMQRLKQYEKLRESQRSQGAPQKKAAAPSSTSKEKKPDPVLSAPPVQSIPPPIDPVHKETIKQPQHKQQIKLTLLNKALPSKIPNPLKKELEVTKQKLIEKDEKPSVKAGQKRQSSPSSTKPVAGQKRSTSSRRDELLKQLKAVEDAIARKRAKFS